MKTIFNFLKKNVWEGILAVGAFVPDIVNYVTSVAPDYIPSLLEQLPQHTLLAKLAVPLALYIKYKKHTTAYKKDELPSGLTKFYDKIPDSLTGVKGSANVK